MIKYFYTLCLLMFSNALLGQCPPDTSITMVPPNVNCIFNDGSNIQDLLIDSNLVSVTGVTDYSIWVTSPPNENGEEIIVNLTADGTVDFSDGPDLDGDDIRDPRPAGLYCFTPIGYDQFTIDSITNNVNMQDALAPCANGGETLEEVINCLSENDGGGGIFANFVSTVDNVLTIIETVIPNAIGYTPCLVRGEPYCIEVRLPGDTTGCAVETIPGDWLDAIEYPSIDPLSIQVRPNPANSNAIIAFEMNEYNLVEIIAFDMLGRQVLKAKTNGVLGTNTYPLNVANWESGVYFYSIATPTATYTQRMLVE